MMRASFLFKSILTSNLCISMFFFGQAQTQSNLKQHIQFLASDKLHGRMTGSKDEMIAARYIIDQFRALQVSNMAGNTRATGYLQSFEYHPKSDSTQISVKGKNVVAYIDNKAEQTIILGAHYDHLGWGLPTHSVYRGEPAIHNGADDNASGVATLIELARFLKASSFKNNNYLLIAFSGEELGLYGSKWFVEHVKYDSTNSNYMLNFDMVGRVDSNKVVVGGVGTSSFWAEAMRKVASPLHIKTTESGIGPSDHTSFYLKNIPVLHFFSGQHKDYHKPSDDEEKINYQGMEDIIDYVKQLVSLLDNKGKIAFVKTKDDSNENTPKFTVTLGVMPDYTFEGEGMRIDGVTDGKPASKAGLIQGDVVIQLGEIKVTDMMGYMTALSKLKKGDVSTIKVKRAGEVLEKEIKF